MIDCLIEHDDDCGVYSHALCNCHPDITMRDADTDRVLCTMRWRGDNIILRFPDPEARPRAPS